MLELDIILEAFMQKGRQHLTPEQCEVFESLLDYPDQVLYDLVMDKSHASDENVSEVIERIRVSVVQ